MAQKVIDPTYQIKTFSVQYDKQLSPLTKTIIQSFKLKLYYYVIDDILYLLKSNQSERDYLLQLLHSSVIFLQNNLHASFFDIYVYDIHINENFKENRFVKDQFKQFKTSNTITIKLAYQVKPITQKVETIW